MLLAHLALFSFFNGAGGAPPVAADVIRNFSLREWRRWRREEDRKELIEDGLPETVAAAIADVAAQQAERLDADAGRQAAELRRALRLQGIRAEARHFEALARRREAFIGAETARLMALAQENEIRSLLLLAAAAI